MENNRNEEEEEEEEEVRSAKIEIGGRENNRIKEKAQEGKQ